MQHDFSGACTIVVSYCPLLDEGENLLPPNSAGKCCCATFQELLCIKEDSELMLESLTYTVLSPLYCFNVASF